MSICSKAATTVAVTSTITGGVPIIAPVPALAAELERVHPRWEDMWATGLQPGQAFDVITSSPLLLQYLEQDEANQDSPDYQRLIPTGRALVPGCGRGYDVTALASADRFAVGLDISPTAVAAAMVRAQQLAAGTYTVEKKAIPASDPRYDSAYFNPQSTLQYLTQLDFRTDSFFDLDTTLPENQYDFVYDYTFLCALEPSIRTDWAKKMSEVVKSGGVLLTLIFPIIEDRVGGPPFKVGLEIVRELLEPMGFECLELRELPLELSHYGRDGTEVNGVVTPRSGVGRWRRK